MKITFTLLGVLPLLLAVGCSVMMDEDTESRMVLTDGTTVPAGMSLDEEEEIPLDEVPIAVKLAALDALPRFVLKEAEREIENGVLVYDLEGEVDGVAYELEVTAAGEVTEIESDDDDDEDEDDDEHEHEHEYDGDDDNDDD